MHLTPEKASFFAGPRERIMTIRGNRSIPQPAAALAILVGLAVSFVGCAGMPVAGKAEAAAERQPAPGDRATGGETPEQQMIVSTAFLTLEVDDVEPAAEAIVAVARRHAGYAVSSGRRTVIRVEAGSLSEALRDLTSIGRVTSRDIQEQDVAKQYSDTSLKLENARAARARYLELLARAENVEAALKVERELERLNGEISMLESTLGNLAHLVQYATINVTLTERVRPGPLGWIFYGIYRAIEWLFVWR
jgi:hypothetical protein